MSISVTALNSPAHVRVYSGFETGKEFATFGITLSEPAPFIMALGPVTALPFRFDIVTDPDDRPAYVDLEDAASALAKAQREALSEGDVLRERSIAAAELKGCAFVGCPTDAMQFRVGINAQHPLVAQQPAGQHREYVLKTRILYFPAEEAGRNTWRAEWTPGPDLKVIVEAKGTVPIFGRPFSIDLGTTNTCAAWMPEDNTGEPKLFQYLNGDDSIPTILVYDQIPPQDAANAGPRVYKIGTQARQANPGGNMSRFVVGVKRYLGLRGQRGVMRITFGNDSTTLEARKVYFDFLQKYLGDFQTTKVRRLQRVKATYPPDYRHNALGAMQDVYRELNIETEKLLGVDEASAAAIWYVWDRMKDKEQNGRIDVAKYVRLNGEHHNLMVFDVGGGTTDISLVSVSVLDPKPGDDHRHEVSMRVLATASLLSTGGDLFTLMLLKALKMRIALAAARKSNGTIAALDRDPDAADALGKIYENLDEYEKLLLPVDKGGVPIDNAANANKIKELLELAELIVPTRWVRFEHKPLKRRDAVNTFYVLWRVAETLKIQLCKQGDGTVGENPSIEVNHRSFSGAGNEYASLRALGANEEGFWKDVRLYREQDLYRYIRQYVTKAVRTCRFVLSAALGAVPEVNSIQLVGNSSKVPLIRQQMIDEFRDIPGIGQIIRPIDDSAKASVAKGACIAASITDFGIKMGLKMTFQGLPERLGWDIGENNFVDGFKQYFSARERPSDRPYFDIDERDRIDLLLHRRRPGDSELEVLGQFRLVDGPKPEAHTPDRPIPKGKLRLMVIPGGEVVLLKDNRLWRIIRQTMDIDPQLDPFSGVH